ncbi:MAG: hypothetical protein HUU50_10450 [Candidatus Brocadiae bacterium]|nr:hypothetical protein [Candidatus Brocadiia bacterium]
MTTSLRWVIILAMDWETMEEDSSSVVKEILELNNLSEYIGGYSYIPGEYIVEGSIEDLYDIIYSDSVNATFFITPYMDEGNIEGYIGNAMATILQENNYEIDYQKYFYQGKEGYVVFLSLATAKDFVPAKRDDRKMVQQIKKLGDKQEKTEKKLPSLRKGLPGTEKVKALQSKEKFPKVLGSAPVTSEEGIKQENFFATESDTYTGQLETPFVPTPPAVQPPQAQEEPKHGNDWNSFVQGIEHELNQAGAYSSLPIAPATQEIQQEPVAKIDPMADRAKKINAPKISPPIPQMYMNLPQEKKQEPFSEWQDFLEGLDESVNNQASETQAQQQQGNAFLEDLKADIAPHIQEMSQQYEQSPYYGQQPNPVQPYYGQQPIPGQPYYGQQPVPGQPYYGQQPVPGQPYYGQQPIPGQPYYGQQPIPGQPYYAQQPDPGQPYYGQQPAMDVQPYYGQPNPGQPPYYDGENIPIQQEVKLDPSQTESKIFKGRHLILTREELALESAAQKFWQKGNEPEEEKKKLDQSEIAAQLAEKHKKAMREDNYMEKRPGYIPSPSQYTADKKDVYEENIEESYDYTSHHTGQEATEKYPAVPQDDIIFAEQEEDSVEYKKPKKRSLLLRFFIAFFLFSIFSASGVYIWYWNGGEKTLAPYIEKARQFYLVIHEAIQEKKQEETQKNIFLENLKALEQELSKIREKINENPSAWKENIQLYEYFINKIKGKPEYKTLQDSAVVEKSKLFYGCQEYLKQTVPQMLEKQQFAQIIDFLRQYKDYPQIKDLCISLEAQTVAKGAAVLNESMEIAKKILVNEEFKEPDIVVRTIEYLDKSNQNQTLEIKRDLDKQKAQFFKPFIEKCEDQKKYEYGIRFLARYLSMQGPHHLLNTEEYIIRLIHRHILYYTSKNQYNLAIQIVQKYEDITSNAVKNAMQKFTNEIHSEQFFWQQLWRGVENLRNNGKEIYFDRIRDKEAINAKGKITRFQEPKQLIEIKVSSRVITNINKLTWPSLRSIFESAGNNNLNAQEASYYGAIYLFSQGHIKEAEEEFKKANRMEDFNYKMQY